MKKKKNINEETLLLILIFGIIALVMLMSFAVGAFSKETGQQRGHVIISLPEVSQGDIFSADIFFPYDNIKNLEGTFNGKKIIFFKNGDETRALVGIDLYQKPGEYELKIIYQNDIYIKKITVKEGEFPISYGWGRGKPYTKQDAKRIIKEKMELKKALEKSRAENLPKTWKTFESPIEISDGFTLKDFMTTPFGQIRILDKGKYGKQKRWHHGTDFFAPTGAPIKSMANGVVAYIGHNLFMEGNIVIINHGAEVYSMYMHLSEISVKKIGQKVKTGELIGRSGSTGNSNKAHLHLGLKINGTLVDPLQILEITK